MDVLKNDKEGCAGIYSYYQKHTQYIISLSSCLLIVWLFIGLKAFVITPVKNEPNNKPD